MRFGEHIKAKRLDMGLSLRAFCLQHHEDPSNWSKLERGILMPPESYERILQIGLQLGYKEDGQEMRDLFDLADMDRGSIPQDIQNDAEAMKKLPLVFRTLRGEPTEAELMRLADIVREAHAPDAQ